MPDSRFTRTMLELESLAHDRMRRDVVPGLQIGLVFGSDEATRPLGVSDIRTGRSVNDRTIFRIASITKTFTATVLVQLHLAGRLDLDAPVRRYVPEFTLADAAAAERVTIRHLLLHTGGFMPYQELVPDGPNALADGARGQVNARQVAPPGALFSYNGIGYMVAGRVIEVVTGCSYEEALRSALLDPLGMTRTKFTSEPDEDIVADHTVRDGKAEILVHPDDGHRWPHPSGGLRSTAQDLLRFMRCHFGETSVLGPVAARAMAEPQVPLPPPRESKALSWFVRDLGEERLLMHLGGAIGQQSLLALCPRRRFGIVVLTNSAVGNAVHSALLARALEDLLDAREPPSPDPIDLASDALAEYEGRFSLLEADVILSRVGSGLVMRVENKGPYAQRPTPPQALLRFWDRDRVVGWEGSAKGQYGDFLRDAGGRVTYFRWSGRARPRAES